MLGLSAFVVIDDPFATLLKKLEEFSKKYPQEKIHIHLDKPYYAIGDDIWFKVYTTDAHTSMPTAHSKIVYVDLIDENNSMRAQLKLPLQRGISWGDIKLSDNLGEGNYRLRAYTQLMRNAGPDFFFDKTLKIGRIIGRSTSDPKQKVNKIIPTTADVQFFPESGNLVEGLTSRVAFKAVNAKGKGEDSEGAIVDIDGTEVTTFESAHLGMGSFFLNPVAGKTYRAKIKFKNGSEKLFDLPRAQSTGYVLSASTLDTTKIGIKVLATNDLIAKGDLNLLAQQNGRVYFSVKIPMAKNLAVTALPRSELPSGIVTLTLFNSNNIPVAERLIFNDSKNDKIKLDLGNLRQEYEKRAPVNLEILGTNKAQPTQGNFSVSVTNATTVEPDLENETHIFTSLLLTSDLRGYIEKPNHYFMENGVKGRQDLDHLLLTQGWRKIDWKTMDGAVMPATAGFEPETALKISGTVTTNSGTPVPNGKVSLFSSSGGIFNIDTLTDANGRFNFDGLEFTDSARFVIQANNEKGNRNVKIKLEAAAGQLITANKNTGDVEVNVNERLKGYLQKSDDYFEELAKKGMLNQTIQLKKVDIVGAKKKVEYSENLNGPGNADVIITAKDLENTQQLSKYLKGRINGIIIYNGKAYLRQGNVTPPPDEKRSMGIVVDGLQLDDFLMDEVNVAHIETVEVLKSVGFSAIYGTRASDGVLVITTKRGGGAPISTHAPGIITYNPKGFTLGRQFYSPRYDTAPDLKPDLRTTVYWNPSIVSDENGYFKLDYFNTDEAGLYRVVIEGIDLMGNLARKTFTYQVK